MASAGDGRFVVVWEDVSVEAGRWILGRRYDAAGIASGSVFQVNTVTGGNPEYPDVAVAADGSFVVAWTSYGQDGGLQGVFAQRYSMIVPVELQSFRIE